MSLFGSNIATAGSGSTRSGLTGSGSTKDKKDNSKRLFNGFLAALGLCLGVLGFYGQIIIKATCGSTPLRNSILGIILLGMILAFVAGTMFFTDTSIMNTSMFVGLLFAIGATTLGLAGVILKNATQKCENDFLCKRTICPVEDKESITNYSKVGDLPCKNLKIVAYISIATGSLLLFAGLIYVFTVYDADRREKEKMKSGSGSGVQMMNLSSFPKSSHMG